MLFGPYKATVVDEHDGDTIFVDILLAKAGKVKTPIDLGFNVWRTPRGTELKRQAVRTLGDNAPELNTPAGKTALAELQTLVKIGDTVTVASVAWDKYGGRVDGTVTLADGRDLTTLMIAAGDAVPWDGTGTKPT